MSTRLARALAVTLAVSTLLGACGLDANDQPQAIAPENLPPDLLDPNPGSSTTLPESPGTTSVAVYFLTTDGERLVAFDRPVADATSPGARIDALLQGPPPKEDSEGGLATSVPQETALLSPPVLDVDQHLLSIDLSMEIFDVEGQALVNAFAQIVWTVTELEGVREVRFLVDGVVSQAQDAEGVQQEGPVSRADYSSLAPRP